MEHKPLFGDLIASYAGLAEELKAVDLAADLTLLLHHAGKSRADLSGALGWSHSRVTQVLSGHENLTVQTITAVAQALGYTFDAVFRNTGDRAAVQPWHDHRIVEAGLAEREPKQMAKELTGWLAAVHRATEEIEQKRASGSKPIDGS